MRKKLRDIENRIKRAKLSLMNVKGQNEEKDKGRQFSRIEESYVFHLKGNAGVLRRINKNKSVHKCILVKF